MPDHSLRPTSPALPDEAELAALHAEINALLPPQYQDCYGNVVPTSMGSAGLKYGPDGRVAWGEIWTHFCDLALAGGPPHRGTLLGPAPAEEVRGEAMAYTRVAEEIGRGLWLTTGLPALPGVAPGWVGVCCRGEAMAAWLVRAVTAENVLARRKRDVLYLPAGPRFRLEKEVKNVITAGAKTCHYWTDHMPAAQRERVAGPAPLLEAATAEEARAAPREYQAVAGEIEHGVGEATGLCVASEAPGWVAVDCADESMAVWVMRAVIVQGVLARREGALLQLPANPRFATAAQARQVVEAFARAHRLWKAHVAQQRDPQGAT